MPDLHGGRDVYDCGRHAERHVQDRDPALFSHVLAWLRSNELPSAALKAPHRHVVHTLTVGHWIAGPSIALGFKKRGTVLLN